MLKQEQSLAAKAAARKLRREDLSGATHRLNKKKFEELEKDVLMTSELKGSLRLTRVRATHRCVSTSVLCVCENALELGNSCRWY